jgi:RNA polymerase sigma-70 factor, ECF subfamily
MTQNELIVLVLDGNQEAFKSLVDQYKAKIFRTCIGFVHNKEDAEELTQDVFVRVYQSLDHFKGSSSFSTWIYRIAVNSSLNHIRKQKRSGFLLRLEHVIGFGMSDGNAAGMKHSESPEKMMIDEERNQYLYKAIDSLPENQRIAFTLSKYDEMSQRDIANVMQITEGAVEALLQRAKANLQKKLAGLIKTKKLTVGNFNQ